MKTLAKRHKRSKRATRPRPTVTAPFALTSTGQLLINVALCEGRKLKGRAVFTGVLLLKNEAGFAEERAENAAMETAASIAGSMPIAYVKPTSRPEPLKLANRTPKKKRSAASPQKAGRPRRSGLP
jgi:hypothetical protein